MRSLVADGVLDLSPHGLLITLGYLVAAVLYLRRGTSPAATPLGRRLSRFFRVLAVVLLALGINKQLDGQLWLTAAARQVALAQGWYPNRFYAHLVFVLLLLVATTGGALAAVWFLRDALPAVVPTVLGLGAVLVYAMLRAASYDLTDLMVRVGGTNASWVLEGAGVGLLLVGARRPPGAA